MELKEKEAVYGVKCSALFGVLDPNTLLLKIAQCSLFEDLKECYATFPKSGTDAEWQSLSAETFGYPHKRERLYCIAYPNSIGRNEKEFQTSIFNQAIPKESGREFSGAIGWAIRNKDNSELLRNDDGFPFVMDRIKACGNAVVPGVAKYLFECIKLREVARHGI